MRLLMAAVASMLAMVAGGAHADTDSATRYYLSLGDSLATGTNASGIGQAFTAAATPTSCTRRLRRAIRSSC